MMHNLINLTAKGCICLVKVAEHSVFGYFQSKKYPLFFIVFIVFIWAAIQTPITHKYTTQLLSCAVFIYIK